MSLLAVAQLTGDPDFGGRVVACATQQAEIFKDDARPNFVALADAALRGESDKQATFWRMAAAGPGIGDKADNGDGTITQAKVSDADLLSLVQGQWPTVAGLFYDAEGQPL